MPVSLELLSSRRLFVSLEILLSSRGRLLVSLSLGGLLVAGAAWAGPNEGGTLVIHAQSEVISNDPCGASAIQACENAVTNLRTQLDSSWWVLAAFPPNNSPRLSGVAFGIEYGTYEDIVLTGYGECGDSAVTMGGFPNSGAGVAVTWDAAQTGHLTETFWFIGYDTYGLDVRFQLIPHPTEGGFFVDDSVPPELDRIEDYGALGFYNDSGYLPCPSGPADGPSWNDSSGAVHLLASHPNPADGPVVIQFDVERAGVVDLFIVDATGRRVCDLIRHQVELGSHDVAWDGLDDQGQRVRSGVYWACLLTGGSASSARLVVIE